MTRVRLTCTLLAFGALAACSTRPAVTTSAQSVRVQPRHMERLGRGVVAIHQGDGRVFVGWRLLGTDPDAIAFNLYRRSANGAPVRLNAQSITGATHFADSAVNVSAAVTYFVRPVLDGREGAENAGAGEARA